MYTIFCFSAEPNLDSPLNGHAATLWNNLYRLHQCQGCISHSYVSTAQSSYTQSNVCACASIRATIDLACDFALQTPTSTALSMATLRRYAIGFTRNLYVQMDMCVQGCRCRAPLTAILCFSADPNLDSPLNGHAATLWNNQPEFKKALLKHNNAVLSAERRA